MTAPGRHRPIRHHPARGKRWARRVRARILANVRQSPVLSAILAALLLPGGVVLVPVIAWWHRRRRAAKRGSRGTAAGATRARAIMPDANHRGQP